MTNRPIGGFGDVSVWGANLHKEAELWDRWFSDPEKEDARKQRIALVNKASPLLKMVRVSPGETIRIIDVGSGPIGTVGRAYLGNPVEVIYADALAVEYNAILDKYCFSDLPRITRLKGEDLVEQFGPASFHAVNCANALDHFEDPKRAFINMHAICKPNGLLSIISYENEGVRENYSGLHQWNLRADDRGIWLRGRLGKEENLLDLIERVSYSWNYRSLEPKVFGAMIRRYDD